MKTNVYCFFLTLLLLFGSNLWASGVPALDDIEVRIEAGTLEDLFTQIETQTDYTFAFSSENLNAERTKVRFSGSKSLQAVLDHLTEIYNIEFRLVDNVFYAKQHSSAPEVTKPIKGSVKDENGEPLIGATVLVKETGNGAITDIDGNFEIDVDDTRAQTLVFSYIGFTSIEMSLGSQSTFSVTMAPDPTGLDEVVVIGYGTGTKEKFNGALSKVDNEQLNNYSSANFEQALAGTVSGVQVMTGGMNPGDNSVIQIRGVNTLTAGTNPLIVVDGNPLTEGSSFSSVNTQDIESISVLKDAASAAIYGSRASNGVILITTKRGSSGNLQVTYDGYVGFNERIDDFQLADAYATARFDLDARNFGYLSGGPGRSITDDNATRDANGGGKRSRIQPFLQDYIDGVPGLTNTDWTDAAFRSAIQQNHYLNFNGGNEATDYSISFGYFQQDNIVISSDYERFSNNIKLNSDISDKISFGVSTNVSFVQSNPTGRASWSRSRQDGDNQANPAWVTVLMQPYYPIYNQDGSFALGAQIDDHNDNWDGPISENIIAQAELSDFTMDEFRVFGNTYMEFEPLRNLKYKASFGGDYSSMKQEYFGPSSFGNYRTPIASNPAMAHLREFRRENFIVENTMTYDLNLERHTFNILGGHSYQQERSDRVSIESRDFIDDNIRSVAGATTNNSTPRATKWSLESYFSRLQYDFDGKYSVAASYRRDGSSRFGANTKYGDFASVSLGWTLSNESFFPQDGLVSFTKIRASWGQTGNNQIGDFSAIALIGNDNYIDGGSLLAGSNTVTSPNADLSWETNTALNFGVDLGFFDNKLLFTAEYYNSNTEDLLLEVPVPQQSGFSNSLQNIGEIENRGFEFEINGRGFRKGELGISFNANITTNENEVIALGNDQDQIIRSTSASQFLTRIGEPMAQFYNYDVIDVYRSQEQIEADPVTPLAGTEVGDYVVRDANGDGRITPDDRVTQGTFNPDFTYGFGFNLEYKGFDLGAQFTGIEGRKVADNMVNRAESGEGFFVPTQYYVDNYFTDDNTDGFFRRPDFSSFSSAGRLTRRSNLSILDGDYFRLRSLQIGYSLPRRITSNLKIDALRVYITGNNLFNITDYRGYNAEAQNAERLDPRGMTGGQTLTQGFVSVASPIQRFMAFGVNVKF